MWQKGAKGYQMCFEGNKAKREYFASKGASKHQ